MVASLQHDIGSRPWTLFVVNPLPTFYKFLTPLTCSRPWPSQYDAKEREIERLFDKYGDVDR